MAADAENTHGMCAGLVGQAAAGEKTIATLTLPADGPWILHHVWAQVVAATQTAAESVGGYVKIESVAGDLEPNPAPAKYPIFAQGSLLGATARQVACPLQMYPIHFDAPGKAQLKLIFGSDLGDTVAPQVVTGIMFGKSVPEEKPLQFCDSVRASITVGTDTTVGTITLSERSTRITSICGILIQNGVITANEELLGFWRMASDDINLIPAQFPFQAAYNGGLGALIGPADIPPFKFIPVDIPVPSGARVNLFCDLNTAVTNAADVHIFLAYE